MRNPPSAGPGGIGCGGASGGRAARSGRDRGGHGRRPRARLRGSSGAGAGQDMQHRPRPKRSKGLSGWPGSYASTYATIVVVHGTVTMQLPRTPWTRSARTPQPSGRRPKPLPPCRTGRDEPLHQPLVSHWPSLIRRYRRPVRKSRSRVGRSRNQLLAHGPQVTEKKGTASCPTTTRLTTTASPAGCCIAADGPDTTPSPPTPGTRSTSSPLSPCPRAWTPRLRPTSPRLSR